MWLSPFPPYEQREKQQRVHIQIGNEPKVVPTEIPLRIGPKLENAFQQERPIAALPLSVKDALEVDLRRHDQEHACDKREQQAQCALSRNLRGISTLDCEPHARASNNEQQRHPKAVRDVHRPEESRNSFR